VRAAGDVHCEVGHAVSLERATAVGTLAGWREGPAGKVYLAYLRDPIGNKICAMVRLPN
jgi:hypothetical protein